MIQIADNMRRLFSMDSGGGRSSNRFILWLDGVGGYWVCRGNEITIGQPDGRAGVDVPILGDVASLHARISRDGEGFLIEALRDVSVDGRRALDFDWLCDGSRIELGDSVRLAFRRPNALSGTVRLDFLSRHRTQPLTDAVLWMADSCVLGPRPHSHVVCRRWDREVLLYRDGDKLWCRVEGEFEIDGKKCRGRGRLASNSRIRGEGFSFSIETI